MLVLDWVMPAFSVNSDADSVVETEIMRIGSAGSGTGTVVALESHAIGLHGIGAVEAGPEAKLHRLAGVDHRAAADGHQQIGLGRARGGGARHHVLARAVRSDLGIGADVTGAEGPLEALQRAILFASASGSR